VQPFDHTIIIMKFIHTVVSTHTDRKTDEQTDRE